MVRIETPFETPLKGASESVRARPRVGAPSHPPSSIDRVLHRADPPKREVDISVRTPPQKAFQTVFFQRSAKFYDHVISRLVAEISRA